MVRFCGCWEAGCGCGCDSRGSSPTQLHVCADSKHNAETLGDAVVAGLQDRINAGSDCVQVSKFAPCTKSELEALSSGAENKRKRYVCVFVCVSCHDEQV